ncbi:MAG: hypothetical protein JSS81_16520 [Acidobacteria bacterium]|nr:hypothetical protein [Acidobacteriota bacterium]
MIKETYAIGDNVQKFCPACDEQFGHIVKSLTKAGLVSRVKCSKCGLTGAYKPSAKAVKIQELAGKTGDPYATTRTYRAGQIIAHPTFGTGEVMTVFNTRTIDVLFADRVRRLVHSRI